jgi:hypothetical protein
LQARKKSSKEEENTFLDFRSSQLTLANTFETETKQKNDLELWKCEKFLEVMS